MSNSLGLNYVYQYVFQESSVRVKFLPSPLGRGQSTICFTFVGTSLVQTSNIDTKFVFQIFGFKIIPCEGKFPFFAIDVVRIVIYLYLDTSRFCNSMYSILHSKYTNY